MNPSTDLNRFYELIQKLEKSPKQGLPLRDYVGKPIFPTRGVYFFREIGEHRTLNSEFPRIVRVGTHAVSTNSKSMLWQRLRTHLGTRNGGGNHRGSIFRLHVGTALLARNQIEVPTWGVGSSAPNALRESLAAQTMESAWEQQVSKYIGAMAVLWINVPDEPSPRSLRSVIEQNTIALLSNRLSPLEPASADWLGLHSPRDGVRRSGLWNLNYIDQCYDPRFLDLFESAVDKTLSE